MLKFIVILIQSVIQVALFCSGGTGSTSLHFTVIFWSIDPEVLILDTFF